MFIDDSLVFRPVLVSTIVLSVQECLSSVRVRKGLEKLIKGLRWRDSASFWSAVGESSSHYTS